MKKIELASIVYWSQKDEDYFFSWMNSIKAIKKYYGRGQSLFIEIDESKLDEKSLGELFALFKRYRIKTGELRVLEKNIR